MRDQRMVFFDVLRYFLAVSIIIFHASLAYSSHEWWPVSEEMKSTTAQWIMVFFGTFTMPFFFFISGYFAVPTIGRKGTMAFIKSKLIKLGGVWIIAVLAICPVLPFIYHYTRNGNTVTMGYFDFWLLLHQNALEFDIGVIGSMRKLMETNGFYLRYMWFLSLLLLFFMIFAVVYRLNKSRFMKEYPVFTTGNKPTGFALKMLFAAGFFTFIGSAIVLFAVKELAPGATDMQPLFTLGNVIQFQTTGIFSYIIYFILGIAAQQRKWIERGLFPGNVRVWAISLSLLTITHFYLYEKLLSYRVLYKDVPTQLIEIIVGLSLFALTHFLTISAVGFFSAVAQKFSHSSTKIKRLTSTAYELYLGHYLFVIVLQLALSFFPEIPSLLKFIIVSGTSVVITQVCALFILKPRPKLAVLIALGILLSMMVFIR